ncbi:MAG: serine dehydratase subunit alpha family protein [Candidatus Bipolaricaulota bacterium]
MDSSFKELLEDSLKPSFGCTDPTAISYAAARAKSEIPGQIKRIELRLDPGTYKNSSSVIIPGTGKSGPKLAACLGGLLEAPELGLEIYSRLDQEQVKKGTEMCQNGKVNLEVDGTKDDIFISTTVFTDDHKASASVENSHTNLVKVSVDGEVQSLRHKNNNGQSDPWNELELMDLVDYTDKLNPTQFEFLLDAVAMNKNLAEEKIDSCHGAVLGPEDFPEESISGALLSESAVSARLTGASKPAMSIAGSGSHGIAASLPVAAAANASGVDKEQLIRSLALSFLTTLYIKSHTGTLSPLCGAVVAASSGASAGITYMQNGERSAILGSLINMAGNVPGIICDGASLSCSRKVYTGTVAALHSSKRSLTGNVLPPDTGIVAETPEKTIENLGLLSKEGMSEVNPVIVKMIQSRKTSG